MKSKPYINLPVTLFLLHSLESAAQDASCRLCSDGSDVPDDFLETNMFFLGGSQTCRTADEFLGRQDISLCEGTRQEVFGDLIVNVESFCGCPASSSGPSLCELCSQGGMVFDDKEDVEVVLYGENITYTCSEIEQMAPFIDDQDVCDDGVRLAEATCCDGQPMVPTPPTPPPTLFPTRMPRTNSDSPATSKAPTTKVLVSGGMIVIGNLLVAFR
jgi:hypothetical protein